VLAPRPTGKKARPNTINIIIRRSRSDTKSAVDFDVIAETMPNRGLASDNIHPTSGSVRDYTRAEVFQLGHEMQDLQPR